MSFDVRPDESNEERQLTSADFGIPSQPNRTAKEAPSVFMRVLRPHTYHGRPQAEGDVYLAHEHEIENIENLKFAVRVPPPPRAVRPVEPVKPVEPVTTETAAPITPQRRRRRT